MNVGQVLYVNEYGNWSLFSQTKVNNFFFFNILNPQSLKNIVCKTQNYFSIYQKIVIWK